MADFSGKDNLNVYTECFAQKHVSARAEDASCIVLKLRSGQLQPIEG